MGAFLAICLTEQGYITVYFMWASLTDIKYDYSEIDLFFLESISIEKSCVSRTEPNLSLYTGPECLANLDTGLHVGSESELLSHS